MAALPALFSALDVIDVAQATGRELEQVAAVYFALDQHLQLDWLRERILRLPRDDRWQALARAALRDDLYAVRAALTAEVLQVGGPAQDCDRTDPAGLRPQPAGGRPVSAGSSATSPPTTARIWPRCRWRCARSAGWCRAGPGEARP